MFKKFILPLVSAILLSLVIWQVQPPQSLTQASLFQIIALFVPLCIFIFSIVFLISNSIPISIISSLTVILFLALKALNLLNIITFIVIVIATIFMAKALKKDEKIPYQTKIPKLSQLKKQ